MVVGLKKDLRDKEEIAVMQRAQVLCEEDHRGGEEGERKDR